MTPVRAVRGRRVRHIIRVIRFAVVLRGEGGVDRVLDRVDRLVDRRLQRRLHLRAGFVELAQRVVARAPHRLGVLPSQDPLAHRRTRAVRRAEQPRHGRRRRVLQGRVRLLPPHPSGVRLDLPRHVIRQQQRVPLHRRLRLTLELPRTPPHRLKRLRQVLQTQRLHGILPSL
ncbi:MAG: hypothetical protein GC159_21570 [Phycisphaera sp.]|nr:hypothetical protein [Phycisphaera sp.]